MCISHPPGEAGNILSQVLEDCICSMRSEEKCELNIELQDGSVPGAPNGSTEVVYYVHLLSLE